MDNLTLCFPENLDHYVITDSKINLTVGLKSISTCNPDTCPRLAEMTLLLVPEEALKALDLKNPSFW
jgi:hypothetical protein